MNETTEELLAGICTRERDVNPETLKHVLLLAIELAREGGRLRRSGTMFVVGDDARVVEQSHPLILDPLWNHPDDKKRIQDVDARGTIKVLSHLDGGFIVSDDGIVRGACRYIDSSAAAVREPMGLGSRHMAGASVSTTTGAVAVVVSSSTVVRVYDNGELVGEIFPESMFLGSHTVRIKGDFSLRQGSHIAVASKSP